MDGFLHLIGNALLQFPFIILTSITIAACFLHWRLTLAARKATTYKNHDIYTDFSTNSIYFTDEISDESMQELVVKLLELRDFLIKKKRKYDKNFRLSPRPIRLYIHSLGGDPDAAFYAADIIEQFSIPIHTVMIGYVASAAVIVAMAGKKRFITKNAKVLVHQVKAEIEFQKITGLQQSLKNLLREERHVNKFFLPKCKLSEKELEKHTSNELWWSSKQCVDYGFATLLKKY
jgi:ATP-dependent Clp protease protease subunit